MLNRKRIQPKSTTINVIFMDGGVGDHVASLVAANYILVNYKHVKPLIWVPDYLLEFARHLLPASTAVKSYSQMKADYDENLPTKTTKWDGVTSPMKIHLLDYAFLKLTDENPSLKHKNYLQIDPNKPITLPCALPSKYVVITAGFTAKVREFPAPAINAIKDYVIKAGFTPVFLGQTKTETGARHIINGKFSDSINFDLAINLINKTTLLQAAKIMEKAAAVIGIDNGLLHIAGCTLAPIVGGFTSVSPEIRMPVRNDVLGWNFYPVVPTKASGCLNCQEKTNFLYGHDYRNCVFKDDVCVNEMSADKFIVHLERILV